MDKETIASVAFMAFCLGFFTLSMLALFRREESEWHRRMTELREFGSEVTKSPVQGLFRKLRS